MLADFVHDTFVLTTCLDLNRQFKALSILCLACHVSQSMCVHTYGQSKKKLTPLSFFLKKKPRHPHETSKCHLVSYHVLVCLNMSKLTPVFDQTISTHIHTHTHPVSLFFSLFLLLRTICLILLHLWLL
jgi:hypothetical protein